MHTGHILTEINKLVDHAKWDDETLADLIEGLTAVPWILDKTYSSE